MAVPDDKRAVLLTPAVARRLLGAAKDIENDPGDRGPTDTQWQAWPNHQFILVTSDTVDGTTGYYPAIVTVYNAVSKAWENYGNVWAMSGKLAGTLTTGRWYAREGGVESTDSKPVFIVIPTACCADTDPDEGGGPGCGCVDGGLSPNFWTFTIAGVTTGTCLGSCDVLNGNWCLQKFNDCGFSQVRDASELCGSPPSLGWMTGALLTVADDGSALLFIGDGAPFGGQIHVTYTVAAGNWNCNTSNVMTRSTTPSGLCSNWPATITIYPSTTDVLCTDPPGGGHDCADCAVTTWTLTISGTADGTCTGCNPGINASFTLSLTTTCTYESNAFTDPVLTCPGPAVGTAHMIFFDNGATGWELWIVMPTGTNKRLIPYAALDCSTGVPNVLPVAYQTNAGCILEASTCIITKAT